VKYLTLFTGIGLIRFIDKLVSAYFLGHPV